MRWTRRKGATAPDPVGLHATATGDPSYGQALNPTYDDQTTTIIRRVLGQGDVGVDVGAHDGSILRQIVEASPDARHHAFEPLPHLADGLRSAFPTVAVHEMALSDVDGQLTFNHVVSNPYYSGLRQRRYDRPDEQIEVIDVVVRRLDDVIPTDVSPRFVKIDVEGAERGVLLGGMQVLSRAQPFIVFEHGLGAADFYDTTPEQVYDILTDGIGLTVTLMASWLDGRPALSRDAFVDDFGSGRNYYFMAHAGS